MKENIVYGFHVVLTTHNSRTSQRMITHRVVKGPPKLLSLNEEIALTGFIKNTILDKKYRCISYNICRDHVHLLLVSTVDDLSQIVKTIKGKSSYLFQLNGFKKKGTPLWSQKFYRGHLDVWQLSTLSKNTGEIYGSSHLFNTIAYIAKNRIKHGLPYSQELTDIIESFTVSVDEAFGVD